MQNTQTSYKTQNNDEQSIDIKGLIYIFLSRWYLFLGGAIIALAVAFLINRYSTNIYQTSGTVLIKEDRSVDPTTIMTGASFGNFQNMGNEMAILKSYTLTERVVKKMNLEVSYFEKGRIATTEMYKTSPFTVEFDRSVPQTVGLTYELSMLDENHIALKAKSEYHKTYDFILCKPVSGHSSKVDIKGEYAQGDWIDNGYNRMRIVFNDSSSYAKDKKRKMMFVINDYPSLVRQMNYSVSPLNKQSSIASIITSGTNRQKIVDFTNALLLEYVSRGLEKKNAVSENTINFIDRELSGIQDSLTNAEIDLQDFRTTNDLMNLDAQTSQVLSTIRALEKEKAEMDVNLKLYKRLQSYIQMQIDDPENLAAPSTMGINDPLINKLVVDLVSLSQAKAVQVITLTEQHPTIIKMDEQILTSKRTLLETVNNLVSNTQMSIAEVDKRIGKAELESRNLPHKQRKLIGYQRKFELNQNTYNYLMQRRAEAQILKASNTPDNEIIDIARLERTYKIAPRSSMNYLIALILGLLIPALFLFLRNYFNTTIQDRKDIEKLTSFPIIGQIIESNGKDPLVVINSPKSSIAESFRSVRTNVEYITQSKPKSIILVTGDSQSVGKTFNSINTASIYALYGKKTVLLGFDMRKPKLFQEFGLNNNIGLSTYLSNKDTLDDVIQASGKIPTLDIITSGPIPPNPAELIASDKCNELFKELQERYDYIIIDTPPLGLVTDAFLLMRHSDVNLYVVRQQVTNKNIFASIIKDIEDRNIKANIILNGIKQEGGYGYRYGNYKYGYSYAYSYGYGRYGKSDGGYYGNGYYGEEDPERKHKKSKK